ncbi:MAG: polymerase, sigma-24 subunit, subfamily [Bacteroidetes bacterium]|nr:polymerase, sigma-24 subunit, subfamily [Bacteroidota bacterium]
MSKDQEPQTDLELVDEVRAGNRQAFTELMRRHQEKIYWVARRMVGSHADADDIVQEAFIKAFLSLGDFRGEAGFYTWLYRIAVNLSLNALRKRHIVEYLRESELAQMVFPAAKEDPHKDLENKELESQLARAVAKLPDKQRAVFIMRYYDEMSYEEIAYVLKTSVGGLKANYFHALRKVRQGMSHATAV